MRVLVEFDTADAALHAMRRLTALGYGRVDTHSPYPLTPEQADAPEGSFPIAAFAFVGGIIALGAAYLVQWYANVWSYPLNIGGRPTHAAPAFVPATFETVCLAAAVAAFVGFLLLSRLPRFWQPVFDVEGFERASTDRFWLSFEATATTADRLRRDILPLGPMRLVIGEEDA